MSPATLSPTSAQRPGAGTSGCDCSPAGPAAGGTCSLARAWQHWLSDRRIEARNQLVIHYSGLVRAVARRVALRVQMMADVEDLTTAGTFGLIDALNRYDTARGVKFESFAGPRIEGAILDALRSLDWVPRSVRLRARQVAAAVGELEARDGRRPATREVAEHLDIDVDRLHVWNKAIAGSRLASLDSALCDGAEPRPLHEDVWGCPQEHLHEREERAELCREVRQLSDRERTVLHLYYVEQQTLREIGLRIGLSESRIFQIHRQAIARLRHRMTALDAA